MYELEELRHKIDEVDHKLIELYEHRLKLSTEVAKYKSVQKLAINNTERERQILQQILAKTPEKISSLIHNFYKLIFRQSRQWQYKYLVDLGGGIELIKKLGLSSSQQVKVQRIGYAGEVGAYGYLAAQKLYPQGCDFISFESFNEVLVALEEGSVEIAVLPIDNSTEGAVNEIYDSLHSQKFSIHKSLVMPIEHCLLVKKGVKVENITKIYSHPQALAQCSAFLHKNIKKYSWQCLSEGITSVAAKKVSESGESIAAIASAAAAKTFNLEILSCPINNAENNSTRFIALSKKHIVEKSADRVSIMFELVHERGSLAEILSVFSDWNINLIKIQSRPIPENIWKYRFYLDFNGKVSEAVVQSIFSLLKEETYNLKILGIYSEIDLT